VSGIPYLTLVVVSVSAITLYRIGKYERSLGVLWALLSIAISYLALRFFGGGMGGVLLGQLLLLVCITLFRMWRNP
jgi:hypothetical protein